MQLKWLLFAQVRYVEGGAGLEADSVRLANVVRTSRPASVGLNTWSSYVSQIVCSNSSPEKQTR